MRIVLYLHPCCVPCASPHDMYCVSSPCTVYTCTWRHDDVRTVWDTVWRGVYSCM